MNSTETASNNVVDDGIARSTMLMTLGTIFSRTTGLLRTWAMAFALGATVTASAYNVANTLPNIIYEIVVGGTLSAAFLPVLMLVTEKKGQKEAYRYCSNIFNIVCILLALLSVLGIIFAPLAVFTQTFTLSGSDNQSVIDESVFLFRLFSFQIFFYGVSAIAQGMINSGRSYFITSIAPALNNVFVIATFIIYAFTRNSLPTNISLTFLGIGTTAGVVIQALLLFIRARKNGWHWKPIINLNDDALKETISIAVPTMVFVIASIIATSIRNATSLSTSESGPAMLSYAWLWFQLPYSVIAVSLSSTMFTEISDASAKEDNESLCRLVGNGLRQSIVLMLPMTACLVTLSEPLIGMFRIGAFTADNVAGISTILSLWAFALPGYATVFYMDKAYAGSRNYKTFAVLCCGCVAIQIMLYFILTETMGLNGIPVTDIIYYTLFALLSIIIFTKTHGTIINKKDVSDIAKMIACSLIAGVTISEAHYGLIIIGISGNGMLESILESIVLGIAGLVIAYGLATMMHVRDVNGFVSLVKRKAGVGTRKIRNHASESVTMPHTAKHNKYK